MKRKIASITGTRADYDLMRPVYSAIQASESLELDLIVTGMHLLPEFKTSLDQVTEDIFGKLHIASMLLGEDSGKAMAQSFGLAVFSIASIFEEIKPDIVLLQGDRGEMLAAAICAAHMNRPIVHMSGGDFSGSIDDSIRNAISKFAHFHLSTCSQSSERLQAMGEAPNRIREVGEPGLDVIRQMQFIPAENLAEELQLDLSKPIILATQHPVTTEAERASWQISQTLEALSELNMQTVFTYPNSDTGGREMIKVLESYGDKPFIRIVPNLGSEKYLSLMRIASILVGNSSSGILEAPSFRLPVVNIGTRQHARLRAINVLDVGYEKGEIQKAVHFVLENQEFRRSLVDCTNPYGDGHTAEKTVHILSHLRLAPAFVAKWLDDSDTFLEG